MERSYIMIKPDGVQRGLIGQIITRFEQKGFRLVAMKLTQSSKEHMEGREFGLCEGRAERVSLSQREGERGREREGERER